MADVISKPLACRECGVEIFKRTAVGRPPLYCVGCRAARRTPASSREREIARLAPTTKDSPPLACRNCGTEIFRATPIGRGPTYCPQCALLARRKARSEHKKRKRRGVPPSTHYTCLDCRESFPRPHRGTLPERCRPCWTERERERNEERRSSHYGELRFKFEANGRWSPCEMCGVSVRSFRQKGPPRRFCEQCRVDRYNAKRKTMRPWIRPGACEDCGGKSPANRRRCSDCNLRRRGGCNGPFVQTQQQALEGELPYGPSWVRRRGGNDPFTALEIFERDRWICGVCRKKIDRKLRYPDRMSATLDHIIPVIEGGLDSRPNVRPAHFSCNASRNHRGGNEQLALLG